MHFLCTFPLQSSLCQKGLANYPIRFHLSFTQRPNIFWSRVVAACFTPFWKEITDKRKTLMMTSKGIIKSIILNGGYTPGRHDSFLKLFSWAQCSTMKRPSEWETLFTHVVTFPENIVDIVRTWNGCLWHKTHHHFRLSVRTWLLSRLMQS